MKRISKRVVRETTGGGGGKVWADIIKLSQGDNIVSDLGQGYPDFAGTLMARKHACETITNEERKNQYSPVKGTPRIVNALKELWNKGSSSEGSMVGTENILVTTSGTEALNNAMQAMINPGDEVIVFEPYFPWYLPAIRMAEGLPVTVTLNGPSFGIDFDQLATKLSSKTKAVLFNTPHNPTGHVATREEIQKLSELCVKHDILCISDEVYDRFTFGQHEHHRIAELPGMAERTLTVGSASKMFSLTGWRVGWIYGPEDLVSAVSTCHGYNSYCAPTPLQEGIATALEDLCVEGSQVGAEIESLSVNFCANARCLGAALEDIGVDSYAPDGGYFLVADVSKTGKTDVEFCRWLAEEKGVICVPMSVFYASEAKPNSLVRFAICKQPETIQTAVKAILKK
mmetsp:Transcript_3608/g.5592  ORF Transcript_3608/g.5592 Transcript_3608/m.5592 type:complete len:400 (-) Transcript_3608:43-1242(-)